MKKAKLHRLYDVNGWAFVLPAVALIALMTLYPIGKSLWLSFQSGRGVIMHFAGMGNIMRLFYDPMFKQALGNTLIFLIIQVPIMILLSLAISSCLNSPRLKYKSFFRLAIFCLV